MKRRYTIFHVLIILIFSGCNKIPDEVNLVLKKAGKNRGELEKVINHYKNQKEKLKLKAAFFLIANMEEKYGVYFNEDAYYFKLLSKIDSLKLMNASEDQINNFIDEDWNKFQLESKKNIPYKVLKDIEVITAKYLIENIDLAYKVWKEKPWAQHLSFDEFCEWILPYRLDNEPLQNWRTFMYNELKWLDDSMKNSSDPKKACTFVNDEIAKNYQFSHKLGMIPDLGGIDSWKHRSGLCENRYALITMAMRSVCIPTAIDYTIQFPRDAGNHSWTVLLDNDGKVKSFNGGEKKMVILYPNVCPIDTAVIEKITVAYRKQYAKNPDALEYHQPINNIPENLRIVYATIVSEQYNGTPQKNIDFTFHNKINSDYVYLFSFNYGLNLNAVAYAKVNNNRVTFNNIGRNAIYMIGTYNNKRIKLESKPFILPKIKGDEKFIKIDVNNTESVKLYRKFYVKFDMLPFVLNMIGASLQASNSKNFSEYHTLYTIDTNVNYYKEFEINCNQSYKYYRYMSSKKGDIRIADMALFYNNGKKTKLTGNVYGYISYKNTKDDCIFENTFDYDIRTNFNAPKGSWVAIDAGKPIKINSFKILARNHLNIVEPGDTYELFYFNNGWISLGKQVAKNHYIVYNGVPKGAILLLKDLTKGKEERIFRYVNGEQVWW